jgi:hypothetical protein
MMLKNTLAIGALIVGCHCAAAQPLDSVAGASLRRIDRGDLCVTNGVVSMQPGGRLAIDSPSSRAVVRIPAAQIAEIRFRFLGPTATAKPLASGELRRQIGLKLRAEDTCNLIYAMWHIEPDANIAVSVKRNAGMHTHEQCGAGGYVNVKARSRIDLPPLRAGEPHTLRAELRGNDLTVAADRRVVWQGTLPGDTTVLDGPVGFRTDNARFELEYYAGRSVQSGEQSTRVLRGPGRCVMSEGD